MNEVLIEFVNKFTKKDAALVLLDPFGMQVKWRTIQNLQDKRIDLWILLPSGVIINRLLDKNGDLKNKDLIMECLGLSETEIKDNFYKTVHQDSLFGKIVQTQKIPDAITNIAKLYIQKLNKIFKYVTDPSLELKNSKNVTIFHFIFASNNEAALKIASQIIGETKKKVK